ncbi:MAG: hypothetical protein JJU36_12005 [Phycisphaeraceae bacterium]|nr:hypothetical protein [Phycisphaeraceae bacterium]
MSAQIASLAPVTGRLASLRRAIRGWILARLWAKLMISLGVFIVATGVLDYMMRFDRAQRGILLLMGLAGLLWLLWRFLLVPASRRLGDEDLLARVERRHPETGESLLSAVEFVRLKNAQALGVSESMVAATIDLGLKNAQVTRFNDIVDVASRRRYLLQGAMAALALAMGIAVAGLYSPDSFRIWFNRMVLLGGAEWPKETNLHLVDFTGVVPRGDNWTQLVRAEGVVPSMVHIDFRPDSGTGRVTEVMRQLGDDTFSVTFQNIREPFRFRVRGGDDVIEWQSVTLSERPAYEELSLTIVPPDYVRNSPPRTRREPRKLPPNQNAEFVYRGSSVLVEGVVNKPIRSATVRHMGRDVATLEVVEHEGVPNMAVRGKVPAEQVDNGVFEFHLVAEDGLRTRRADRMNLTIRRDDRPRINTQLIGISSMVVPEATIPMLTTIEDDFAVMEVALKAEIRGGAADRSLEIERARLEELRRQRDGDQRDDPDDQAGDEEPGGPQTAGGPREIRMPARAFDEWLGQDQVGPVAHRLELIPLDLEVGQSIQFMIVALDNDDIGGPNEGESTPFFLRVVSRDVLAQELLRREQEQRRETERVLRTHQEMVTDLEAMLADVARRESFSEDDRAVIIQAERAQRLAGNQLRSVAEQFSAIMQEHENNKMDDDGGRVRRRMNDRIILPLRAMAINSTPAAANLLEQAGQAGREKEERIDLVAQTNDMQRQIIDQLREVLTYMERWEGYQELVNQLRALSEDQVRIRRQLQEAVERETREIFD